jgi:hypothetical protein
MKWLAVAFSVLLLVGCEQEREVTPFFIYCTYVEGDWVYVSEGNRRQPVVASITKVFGGRKDGCWYTIQVEEGHIYPKDVTIKESRIITKATPGRERR